MTHFTLFQTEFGKGLMNLFLEKEDFSGKGENAANLQTAVTVFCKLSLTLSKTTNLRHFQTKRVCRLRF